jgi:membrane-bound serine protease (ClpP class)
VTGILLFVGILGIYVELNTPGLGLPGAVAVIAFAILFGSRYLTNLAQWWEIGLFLAGLVLIAIEVFVTPGFGVLGISGLICCIVGLLAIIIPNAPDKLPVPQTELEWGIFRTGLTALGLAFLGAVVAAIILGRYLPKMPLASKLILAPASPSTGPATESAPIRLIQVGQMGTVQSICRPVGQVRFGDKLVDAVADGSFIPAGTKVKVIRNEGNRVVVTPMES